MINILLSSRTTLPTVYELDGSRYSLFMTKKNIFIFKNIFFPFSYLNLEVAVMYQDVANKEYLNLLIDLNFKKELFNRI